MQIPDQDLSARGGGAAGGGVRDRSTYALFNGRGRRSRARWSRASGVLAAST